MTIDFPSAADEWAAEAAESAGFDSDALEAVSDWLQTCRSSSFLGIHDGRIFVERHWRLDSPSPAYANTLDGVDSGDRAIENVASAQKSVTAVLTAIAVERGFLEYAAPVHEYLGAGWSNAPAEDEAAITLRHVMSMTTGLTDEFELAALAGTVWHYNTPVYQTLIRIAARAAGTDPNDLIANWLCEPLGMRHTRWVERPFGTTRHGAMLGLATTARDLARFGLLILSGGVWAGRRLVSDSSVREMLSPSQALNEGYGLLWWLNGSERPIRLVPQGEPPNLTIGEVRSETRLAPDAPPDMVVALGALDRYLFVVPSWGLVVVRLGDSASNDLADQSFVADFWTHLARARS